MFSLKRRNFFTRKNHIPFDPRVNNPNREKISPLLRIRKVDQRVRADMERTQSPLVIDPDPPVKRLRIVLRNPDYRFPGGQHSRLSHFIGQWENLGTPQHILSILKGYLIPFRKKPPSRPFSLTHIKRFGSRVSP